MDKLVLHEKDSNIFGILLNNISDKTTVIFNSGVYTISNSITINANDIKLIGIGNVTIKQLNDKYDLFNIKGKNISIKNIIFDCEISDSHCLTITNNCNFNIINCTFFGGDSPFVINISGNDNIPLNNSNIFANNTINSGYKRGLCHFTDITNLIISNNMFFGGKLCFENISNLDITGNIIKGSEYQGIMIDNTKAKNIKNIMAIYNNKLLKCKNAAIFIKNIGNIDDHTNSNIKIFNNNIYQCKYMGIEVNNCSNFEINNNKLSDIVHNGIYILKGQNFIVNKNIFSHMKKGVYVHKSKNLRITDNILNGYFGNKENIIYNENNDEIYENNNKHILL